MPDSKSTGAPPGASLPLPRTALATWYAALDELRLAAAHIERASELTHLLLVAVPVGDWRRPFDAPPERADDEAR